MCKEKIPWGKKIPLVNHKVQCYSVHHEDQQAVFLPGLEQMVGSVVNTRWSSWLVLRSHVVWEIHHFICQNHTSRQGDSHFVRNSKNGKPAEVLALVSVTFADHRRHVRLVNYCFQTVFFLLSFFSPVELWELNGRAILAAYWKGIRRLKMALNKLKDSYNSVAATVNLIL